MTAHYCHEIQGWFDFQDVYRDAVATAPNGATLVEVGCWRGQSLCYLLVEAANSGKRLDVVGVDHFRGGRGDDYHAAVLATGADVEAECRANCDRAGYPYRLMAVGSTEAARAFADDSLALVFIDASHDYQSVRSDVAAWLPKVRRGGMLAGHDYEGAWPGVKHAVRDHFTPGELTFSGCSWLYRKVEGPGTWTRSPPPGADWLLYLPFVNRPELLAAALSSLGDHASRAVVIDQSDDGLPDDFHPGPLLRWTGRPQFTEVMTWAQRDAIRRKLRRHLFMHADARAARGGLEMLLNEADRLDAAGQRFGAVFSHYDALALFNPQAAADVGCWDGTFGWYVADADYYNRLRWAGWPIYEVPAACAFHHGSATLEGLDEARRREVKREADWAVRHYFHKWGCHWEDGEGRRWAIPYDGRQV